MTRTITEKYDKDGKLVERITVEETHEDSLTVPEWELSPWWGILPPPRYHKGWRDVSTTETVTLHS